MISPPLHERLENLRSQFADGKPVLAELRRLARDLAAAGAPPLTETESLKADLIATRLTLGPVEERGQALLAPAARDISCRIVSPTLVEDTKTALSQVIEDARKAKEEAERTAEQIALENARRTVGQLYIQLLDRLTPNPGRTE